MMSRTTDGLYRRGDYYDFKFKSPADGSWRERATRTSVYGEARKIRQDFLLDLENGNVPNDRARWTLKQATVAWLAERKNRIAQGSFASESTTIRTLLRVLGDATRLEKLGNIQAIQRFENIRLAQGISPKTINNEVVVLAGMLREARLWQRVESDYRRLAVRKSDIPDALTRDEAYRLLKVARLSGDDAVVPFAAVLSYATGMRSKEIKQLR